MNAIEKRIIEDAVNKIVAVIAIAKAKGQTSVGIARTMNENIIYALVTEEFRCFYRSVEIGNQKLLVNIICWDECWNSPGFQDNEDYDIYYWKISDNAVELCKVEGERAIKDGRCKFYSEYQACTQVKR